MDRNAYKSEEQLASQGWKSMRQALDRELPEERRPRPVLLFWILGLLLPTAGLLYWLTGPQATPPAIPGAAIPVAEAPRQTPPNAAPVSPQDNETTTHTKEPAVANLPAGNLPPAASGKGVTPLPTETTTRVQSKSLPGTQQEQLVQKTPGATPNTMPGIQPARPGETSRQPERPDAQETLPQFYPAASSIARLPEQTRPELMECLPHASTLPSSISATAQTAPDIAAGLPITEPQAAPPFPLLPIDPAAKAGPSGWSFGATAGVLSDKSVGYAGSVAGLTTEWQLNQHWGLRSGLNYQFQSLREADRSIVALEASTYVNATGDISVLTTSNGFNTSSSDPAEEPVYLAVSRMHRLELPILAYWQPADKWRLFGGMAVGNTLFAQAGNQSLKSNTVFSINSGDATQNLNQEITDQLRAWSLSWSAGVGFRPGKHFAVDLFIQNPLQFKRALSDTEASPGSFGGKTPDVPLLSGDRTQTPGGRTQLQVSATLFF